MRMRLDDDVFLSTCNFFKSYFIGVAVCMKKKNKKVRIAFDGSQYILLSIIRVFL